MKDDLKKIEEEIDKIVAKLYEITDEELGEIRKCLKILKEGEIEEEEKEEEEVIFPIKDIEVKVEPLLVNEEEEKEIVCSISNNMDKDMENVRIKILLDSKDVVTKKSNRIKKSSSESVLFKIPKLKAGEYELVIKIKFDEKALAEKRKLFVKKKEKEKKIKSVLDEEIERMLK